MAKFELSIHEDYLAGRWGTWEGIREVVQNALDAQDDYPGYPMEISHTDGCLQIRNVGAVLGQEVLLLGKTTKDGRDDQRGQFGEGLKLGLLALVRQNIEVYIMNGSTKWTPSIDTSENFGNERVLWINVRKMQKREEDFTVYIKIPKAEWKSLRGRFLDLVKGDLDVLDHAEGSVIMDPSESGNVYAKGIFVKNYPYLQYGYNFNNITLDRDRGMIDDWDLRYAAAKALKAAMVMDREKWVPAAYEMMRADEVKDLEKLPSQLKYDYDGDTTEIRQEFADLFTAEYGADAVPVSCEEEAVKVEFYGKKGVVVPQTLRLVLETHFGDSEDILKKASISEGEFVAVSALDPVESKSLKGAIRLLYLADAGSLEDLDSQIKVFDFQDTSRLGIYEPSETVEGTSLCRIRIARKCLGSISRAVEVLIHEKAHEEGNDGTLDHGARMENLWRRVTENLLEMAGSGWLFE